MTQTEINVLEKLRKEYDQKFGEGKAEVIAGSLMFSHGYEGIIKVFQKAKGCKIILEDEPGVILKK
jgi:hypothetical protein